MNIIMETEAASPSLKASGDDGGATAAAEAARAAAAAVAASAPRDTNATTQYPVDDDAAGSGSTTPEEEDLAPGSTATAAAAPPRAVELAAALRRLGGRLAHLEAAAESALAERDAACSRLGAEVQQRADARNWWDSRLAAADDEVSALRAKLAEAEGTAAAAQQRGGGDGTAPSAAVANEACGGGAGLLDAYRRENAAALARLRELESHLGAAVEAAAGEAGRAEERAEEERQRDRARGAEAAEHLRKLLAVEAEICAARDVAGDTERRLTDQVVRLGWERDTLAAKIEASGQGLVDKLRSEAAALTEQWRKSTADLQARIDACAAQQEQAEATNKKVAEQSVTIRRLEAELMAATAEAARPTTRDEAAAERAAVRRLKAQAVALRRRLAELDLAEEGSGGLYSKEGVVGKEASPCDTMQPAGCTTASSVSSGGAASDGAAASGQAEAPAAGGGASSDCIEALQREAEALQTALKVERGEHARAAADLERACAELQRQSAWERQAHAEAQAARSQEAAEEEALESAIDAAVTGYTRQIAELEARTAVAEAACRTPPLVPPHDAVTATEQPGPAAARGVETPVAGEEAGGDDEGSEPAEERSGADEQQQQAGKEEERKEEDKEEEEEEEEEWPQKEEEALRMELCRAAASVTDLQKRVRATEWRLQQLGRRRRLGPGVLAAATAVPYPEPSPSQQQQQRCSQEEEVPQVPQDHHHQQPQQTPQQLRAELAAARAALELLQPAHSDLLARAAAAAEARARSAERAMSEAAASEAARWRGRVEGLERSLMVVEERLRHLRSAASFACEAVELGRPSASAFCWLERRMGDAAAGLAATEAALWRVPGVGDAAAAVAAKRGLQPEGRLEGPAWCEAHGGGATAALEMF